MARIKQFWLLTGVLVVAMLGAGYFFGMKPQAAKAKKIAAETAVQAKANTSLRGEIALLRKQAAGVVAQKNRLRQIAGVLPPNPGLPKLVRSLSAVTKASGVDLNSISPGLPALVPEVATTAPAPTAAASSSASPAPPSAAPAPRPVATAGLAAIPLNLSLTGDFAHVQLLLSNLEKFDTKVAKFDRAFVVDTITVTPIAEGAAPATSKTKKNYLAVSVVGRVFMKGPPVAPTKAPAAVAPEK